MCGAEPSGSFVAADILGDVSTVSLSLGPSLPGLSDTGALKPVVSKVCGDDLLYKASWQLAVPLVSYLSASFVTGGRGKGSSTQGTLFHSAGYHAPPGQGTLDLWGCLQAWKL